MYDLALHRRRKHFCRYCVQAFSTDEILKLQIKDFLKINHKQRIKMPKNDEYNNIKKL